jgi:hypothetical protein
MNTTLWVLLSVQGFLGFLDIVAHHELTQRLAWRPCADTELRLHGVRNLLYVVLYLTLAWLEPTGRWAALVVAVLAMEVVFTFWDWVEEDKTRPLPATERALHGVLTINYGFILAMLTPVLWEWHAAPTALTMTSYGIWTWLATLYAIVAGLLGVKDLLAARRVVRLRAREDRSRCALLADELDGPTSFLITGGTGLIGARLIEVLLSAGHKVTVLTRRPEAAAALGTPITVVTSLAQLSNDTTIDAVVHLAGASLANPFWTNARRRLIVESRTSIADDLGVFIQRVRHKPRVWINASAIGWYEKQQDGESPVTITERSGPGSGFTNTSCEAVEAAVRRNAGLHTRFVNLRIGMVVAKEGGFLGNLLPTFDLMFGAILGDGRHWLSWIHRDDLVRVIAFCVARGSMTGAVNACSLLPCRFSDLASAIAGVLHRPRLLRIPAWPLRLFLRGYADELLLASTYVVPDRLLTEGFEFRYPDVRSAVDACVNGAPTAAKRSTKFRFLTAENSVGW